VLRNGGGFILCQTQRTFVDMASFPSDDIRHQLKDEKGEVIG